MAGEILKQRREESKQNLREIAGILRIRQDYLRAIENDDFGRLPTAVYAKCYIRDYARYLKVDPQPVIDAYSPKTLPAAAGKNSSEAEASGVKDTRRSLLPVAIIPLVVIACAYIIFSVMSWTNQVDRTEKINQPAAQTQNIPKETPPPVLNEAAETAAVQPAMQENQKVATGSHTLEIIATDTTWLLANIDEKAPVDIVLRSGESLKLHARDSFTLKIGNAGGIKLIFDGKDMGQLGNKGDVVTLNLNSANNPGSDLHKTN